ncbi:unnamed protein product [Echinostoma caproni]|uniref:Hira domain-containing protein n=1 Tax=Echinostoma caproni TaxID=27848 RepID=A0A183A3E1_9TREM|nr:unnamed protein product [Echinostoma caproni]
MGFLRLALSSHPPESLPLPAGFSLLCDITHRPVHPSPVVMATGGHLRPNGPVSGDSDQSSAACSSASLLSNATSLSLSHLASRLLPLLAHNRHVFGPWYAEIIQNLLTPQKPVGADDTSGLSAPAESKSADTGEETAFEMNT